MKTIFLGAVILVLYGCNLNKITLSNIKSKKSVYFDSVFESNVRVFISKEELLRVYPKNLNKIINKEDRVDDSLFFNFIRMNLDDSLRIAQDKGLTLSHSIYDLLIEGKVIVFDRLQNRYAKVIYKKLTKSKLGQVDIIFYISKPDSFFYSYLLSFGE